VRFDGKGNLYVCSYAENTIRVVDAKGNVRSVITSRVEGYLDGPVAEARIRAPRGLVFDSRGNLFFSDCWNHRIRKITPAGIVSTLAGGGPTGVEAKAIWRDGTGAEARFFAPCGMAIDGDDNLYVADAENHRIRKITPRGVVTTIAGHGISGKAGRGFADGPAAKSRLNTPTEVFVTADGSVYFSDTYGNRIRKISP
jgi:DNA-binding beta-propeller fold protein YncE